METVDGVEPEHVDGVPEKAGEADGSNELVAVDDDDDNDDDALHGNGSSQDPPRAEGIDSSGVGEGKSEVVAGKNALKVQMAKGTKGRRGRKGEEVHARNSKAPILSKSLTFPAKAVPASNLRKSMTFVKTKKTDVKNSGRNGAEVVPLVTNGGLRTKQADTAVTSITRRSLHVKSGSVASTANSTSSKVPQSNDGNKKPVRHAMPVKSEDDSLSTTSTAPSATSQRKRSGSGFSFKLDERAEKRKEFFSKLEEKIHAKEMEKTNLQEQSKESQEAEIKRLRKSLMFKATPMPNFYQESGPPKVELKKVPPTRPRSPKLGRHKPSVTAAAENASEGNAPNKGARPSPEPGKLTGGVAVDSLAQKKLTQRSLSKLPSQKSTIAKPEEKPAGTKPKPTNLKQKVGKPVVVENDKPTQDSSFETVASTEIGSLTNTTKVDASIHSDLSGPGIVLNQLADPGIPHKEINDLGITPNQVLLEG